MVTEVVKYLLALVILLQGCASVPRWSDNLHKIVIAATWGEEYEHDVWNYAKAAGRTFERAMPYICVDDRGYQTFQLHRTF